MKLNEKFKMSVPQFIAEVLALLSVIAYAITFIVLYAKAPATISRQVGFKITSIEKSSLLVLFFVCLIVYGVISFLQFYPKIWNDYSQGANSKQVIENLKMMISCTKIIFITVLFYISITALNAKPLQSWFMISAIILTVLEIAFFLTAFFVEGKRAEKSE